MTVAATKFRQAMENSSAVEVVRLEAVRTNSVIDSKEMLQAQKQAKKIMQALDEVEQIQSGKIKATTFEAYFIAH